MLWGSEHRPQQLWVLILDLLLAGCDCGQLPQLLEASQSLISKVRTTPNSHGLCEGYKAVPGVWPMDVSPGFSCHRQATWGSDAQKNLS